MGTYRGKWKKVKNNSKVTLDSSSGNDAIASSLVVIFQNKKTGKKELLEYGYINYGKGQGGTPVGELSFPLLSATTHPCAGYAHRYAEHFTEFQKNG